MKLLNVSLKSDLEKKLEINSKNFHFSLTFYHLMPKLLPYQKF